jgi:hypothetical protein
MKRLVNWWKNSVPGFINTLLFFLLTLTLLFGMIKIVSVQLDREINARGGMRQIIVDTGREVRSIVNDINKENNNGNNG